MKDRLKFAGSSLLMMAALSLINLVFVQALAGDYDWLNILLTVLYTIVVLLAAVYEGVNRGAKDCKFTRMMEKQKKERGYVLSKAEEEKLFTPSKGIIAGLIGSIPAIVLSVASMIVNDTNAFWLTFATRISLGEFLGFFGYADALIPWIYLPLALVYPVCMGIAYTFGPKAWDRQVQQMEKAKREKRRKVNRRRKKKPVVQK